MTKPNKKARNERYQGSAYTHRTDCAAAAGIVAFENGHIYDVEHGLYHIHDHDGDGNGQQTLRDRPRQHVHIFVTQFRHFFHLTK